MQHENISAALGQTFEVALEETSTSGYLWRVGVVPEGIELVESWLDSPSRRSPVGAGGHRRFLFRASRPRVFNLPFELRREWEWKRLQNHIVVVEVDQPD